MDRGKKALEKVGEWTTIHKKPNKGKIINSNQEFVTIPAQAPFYPNQGYYVSYPMVRQPVGTYLSLRPKMVSQFPWSQPNSAFQVRIDLMTKAQYLLQQEIYRLWTDRRRILAYETRNI
ncbi:hypothetical protein Gotur_017541 [Gossypium turneri]